MQIWCLEAINSSLNCAGVYSATVIAHVDAPREDYLASRGLLQEISAPVLDSSLHFGAEEMASTGAASDGFTSGRAAFFQQNCLQAASSQGHYMSDTKGPIVNENLVSCLSKSPYRADSTQFLCSQILLSDKALYRHLSTKN